MNILITSASRKVWLVRAFQQALAATGGGQVLAGDASPYAAALHVADKGYLLPRGLGESFEQAIDEVCRRHAVRLIVPTRDEELPFFAARREAYAARGIRVMVSSPETIAICQDKARFIEHCAAHGLAVPKTYALADLESLEAFPLFLKERVGKAGKGVFVAENRRELLYALEKMREPIVQEHVDAPEYTIDLCADFDGRVLSVVPRRRLSIVSGESFVGQTFKHQPLIDEAVRLAASLGLVGHTTIQCFLHEGQIKFIEVNPRYGGGANLGFAAGASTPHLLVRLLLGHAVEPSVGSFRDGYIMLRHTDDVFLSTEELGAVEPVN